MTSTVRRETGMIEEDGVLSDAEEFTFTYKLRDDTYELYDEQQILYPTSHTSPTHTKKT